MKKVIKTEAVTVNTFTVELNFRGFVFRRTTNKTPFADYGLLFIEDAELDALSRTAAESGKVIELTDEQVAYLEANRYNNLKPVKK